MTNVKPGDVICFRVGRNNKTIETPYYIITKFPPGILETKYGITVASEFRYELELIDPARVTIADEVKPVAKKWYVEEFAYYWSVRPFGAIDGGDPITFGKRHPDAEQRARKMCDELNERDTPKPRWVVRKSDREPSWYEVLDAQRGVREFGGYQFYSLALARDMCDVMEQHYERTTGN